jgi:hypothetical protein
LEDLYFANINEQQSIFSRTYQFSPYFQNKKIIAQKANKKTFKHYDLNALIAQNKLSLAVLKLAKEREKLRKSILKFEHQ